MSGCWPPARGSKSAGRAGQVAAVRLTCLRASSRAEGKGFSLFQGRPRPRHGLGGGQPEAPRDLKGEVSVQVGPRPALELGPDPDALPQPPPAPDRGLSPAPGTASGRPPHTGPAASTPTSLCRLSRLAASRLAAPQTGRGSGAPGGAAGSRVSAAPKDHRPRAGPGVGGLRLCPSRLVPLPGPEGWPQSGQATPTTVSPWQGPSGANPARGLTRATAEMDPLVASWGRAGRALGGRVREVKGAQHSVSVTSSLAPHCRAARAVFLGACLPGPTPPGPPDFRPAPRPKGQERLPGGEGPQTLLPSSRGQASLCGPCLLGRSSPPPPPLPTHAAPVARLCRQPHTCARSSEAAPGTADARLPLLAPPRLAPKGCLCRPQPDWLLQGGHRPRLPAPLPPCAWAGGERQAQRRQPADH